MKLKELIIDRSKWLRGEGHFTSALLRADGKMCCLGFLALSCGASSRDILEKVSPSQTCDLPWPKGAMTANYINSRVTCDLMKTNDKERAYITEPARERKIRSLFKELDYKVKFVGRTNVKKTNVKGASRSRLVATT